MAASEGAQVDSSCGWHLLYVAQWYERPDGLAWWQGTHSLWVGCFQTCRLASSYLSPGRLQLLHLSL